jgi:Raf kinase inhibitor-like YbhB/YbcL family protein
VAAAAVLALAGCGGSSSPQPQITTPIRLRTTSTALAFTSSAFESGTVPRIYTCDGRNVSPPVRWSSVPRGTREMALELIDPDAPGGPFVHWALVGIRPSLRSLAAGESVPPGAVAGRNGFGHVGYGGPCPPPGKPHRYVLVVFALGSSSGLSAGFAPAALPSSHALAMGQLTATYGRG